MSIVLEKTAAELMATLEKADNAVQPDALEAELDAAIDAVEGVTGLLANLSTSAKSSLVAAINELFTSAGNGKSAIATAITGMGISAGSGETWASLSSKIAQIRSDWVRPKVVNGGSITPSGSYANSTYYDTGYGVKIGYMANGDVILSMRGGTTTADEYLYFYLASAPSGVTLTAANNFTSSSYTTGAPRNIYACVLSGISGSVRISVSMDQVNNTYDYTRCSITVTAA